MWLRMKVESMAMVSILLLVSRRPRNLMVYLSVSRLFDQVKRQSSYRFEDLGLHSLKNISEQIRLYKVIGGMSTYRFLNKPSKKHSELRKGFAQHRLPFCHSKSPVAMKISNTSLMGSQKTSLWNWPVSRNCLSAHAARALPMRPMVSTRERLDASWELNIFLKVKSDDLGSHVRISVRLINVQSGEHLWAERFDRPFDDLFEILDQLVSRIVGTIVGRVEAADMAEARRKRPEDRTAYDYLLRGLEYHRLGGVTRDNLREAVKWYERSIAADPNYGLAYAWHVCASSGLPGFDLAEGMKIRAKGHRT